VKADAHFPICVGACGRRGNQVVWYQIAENARLGECLRCYDDRQRRAERIESLSGPAPDPEWDPPDAPTGPTGSPLPWKL
jgi:hypothetical protein